MKKPITILCVALFSACTQAAQTEVTTVTTTVTTETTTETALTVTTTTASVSAESSAAETTETTETATEATTETTTETTTATESTEAETTAGTSSVSGAESTEAETDVDEEKQRILDEMPDIVFVMSHHYDDTNILGFYVTKTGEVKMYDFRSISPNETYEIPDVYDRLEEATCDRLVLGDNVYINKDDGKENGIVEEDELPHISEHMLIDCYKRLKLTNGAFCDTDIIPLDENSYYAYYGIRQTGDKREIVIIGGGSSEYVYRAKSGDDILNELCHDVSFDIFPYIPEYF